MTEGRLLIRLVWDGSRVVDAEIRSTRSFAVGHLLAGMPVQRAVDTVPMLFSLCSKAQGIAACLAAEAAQGLEPEPGVMALRVRLVRLEAVQEYLWRLLLDWPRLAGQEPRPQELAALRNRLGGALRRLQEDGAWKVVGASTVAVDMDWSGLARELGDFLVREVLGRPVEKWLEMRDAGDFESWARSVDTPTARILAALETEAGVGSCEMEDMPQPTMAWWREVILPAMRAEETFSRAPSWNGRPLETGSLSRMGREPLVRSVARKHGHGLLARLAARLLELVRLARGLDDGGRDEIAAFSDRKGEGVAGVETARGLLVHRAEVVGGQITAYQIVAPTEWNFHPAGVLKRVLGMLRAENEQQLLRRAGWLVQALDPCVGYEIAVSHA